MEAGFGVRFEDEGGVRCFVIGCRILDAVFGRIVRLYGGGDKDWGSNPCGSNLGPSCHSLWLLIDL